MAKIIRAYRKGEPHNIIVDDDFYWEGKIHIQSKGYLKINKNGKQLLLHRYIMNAKKGEQVDHINGNKLDNRRENLRIVTNRQNNWNKKSKGYSWNKQARKWNAQITLDNKNKHLGYYDKEDEAREAYRKAHVEAFGEYSPYYKELTE